MANKKVRGKKSLFKESYCEQAENYSYLGVTDVQLASFFKVTERTIRIWKKKHPSFNSALKKGKDTADAMVAKSLYQRAIGFDFDEEKKEYKGARLISRTVTRKHVPPETVACIYWLNNRQPDKWKNRWEGNKEGNMTITIKDDGDSNTKT